MARWETRVALVISVSLAGAPGASGQAADAPPCPWPADLDAVAAAPANHRVVLENARVRVLDVTVEPGEREKVHAHCRKSVMYLMQEGLYRDYDAGGNVIEDVTAAPPASQFPMTLWLEPQGPHAVHNLDARATRLLRIELKDANLPAEPCPPSGAAMRSGYEVLLDNDRARVLARAQPGRQAVTLTVSCRPSVVIEMANREPYEPQAWWLEAGSTRLLAAAGSDRRLLRIELKR